MSIGVPTRLSNGIGNWPDAAKFMDNYDYLAALIFGNFSLNGGMELWNAATSFTNPANAAAVADSWTVLKSGTSGATADVSREATIINSGVYSMKVNITGAGSANSIWNVHQSLTTPARFASETVLLGVRCRAATANKLRCKVYDGANTSYSVYHSGDSSFQLLTAQLAVAASPSELTLSIEVNPSDFTGAIYIDSVFLFVVPASISVATKSALAYSALTAGFLPLAGGLMTGPLAMGSNDITGLVDGAMTPASAGATATGLINRLSQIINQIKVGFGLTNWYDSASAVLSALLSKAGGTMSGDIVMATHKITGIGNGSAAQDVPAFGQIPIVVDWTDFNPSTPTNITKGNGAILGEYRVIGKSLTVRVYILAGSTTSIGGLVDISGVIPAGYTMDNTKIISGQNVVHVGSGNYNDVSTTTHYLCAVVHNSSGAMYITFNQNGNVLTTNIPVAMAASDVLSFTFEVPIT